MKTNTCLKNETNLRKTIYLIAIFYSSFFDNVLPKAEEKLLYFQPERINLEMIR
jgi:hypothetical protein